jgi:hypothetical protein
VRVWSFVRPNLLKVVSLAVLLMPSLLVVVQREATSLVTWEQRRGMPLAFVTLDEFRGPCAPSGEFCHRLTIRSLDLFSMVFDVLMLYLIACVVGVVSRHVLSAAGRSQRQAE